MSVKAIIDSLNKNNIVEDVHEFVLKHCSNYKMSYYIFSNYKTVKQLYVLTFAKYHIVDNCNVLIHGYNILTLGSFIYRLNNEKIEIDSYLIEIHIYLPIILKWQKELNVSKCSIDIMLLNFVNKIYNTDNIEIKYHKKETIQKIALMRSNLRKNILNSECNIVDDYRSGIINYTYMIANYYKIYQLDENFYSRGMYQFIYDFIQQTRSEYIMFYLIMLHDISGSIDNVYLEVLHYLGVLNTKEIFIKITQNKLLMNLIADREDILALIDCIVDNPITNRINYINLKYYVIIIRLLAVYDIPNLRKLLINNDRYLFLTNYKLIMDKINKSAPNSPFPENNAIKHQYYKNLVRENIVFYRIFNIEIYNIIMRNKYIRYNI